eukprot:Gb_33353 [translate_table: standard]
MIEAVENHMPQTIVIDEIGTELEALAASTIAQRGIQLVGTAHGNTIENLIKNPSLEILVGGIQCPKIISKTVSTFASNLLPKSHCRLDELLSPIFSHETGRGLDMLEILLSLFLKVLFCGYLVCHIFYRFLVHSSVLSEELKMPVDLYCLSEIPQSVTLGDDEALRRGVQKTVLERKGPPTFTCAVEMMSRTQWRVHHSLETTVDAVLAGRSPLFEVRKMNIFGVIIGDARVTTESELGSSSSATNEKPVDDADRDIEVDIESSDDNDYVSVFRSRVKQFGRDDNSPLHLYTYQV